MYPVLAQMDPGTMAVMAVLGGGIVKAIDLVGYVIKKRTNGHGGHVDMGAYKIRDIYHNQQMEAIRQIGASQRELSECMTELSEHQKAIADNTQQIRKWCDDTTKTLQFLK